ncbi:VOC family protein [Paenibacillus silvisoli]|uniref:VOC family protein n=1 Tax=Paenibacillus silvisoli TaxID=3110539 RepID=UPI0028055997|nr:VOC family protein [Paenibacillus silvisoli]
MSANGKIELDCFRLRVRRLKPAIRFYSALFGVPVVQELVDGEQYVFQLADGRRKLVLDDIRQADIREPNSRPIAIMTTPDLEACYRQVQIMNLPYVSGIEQGIEFPYFVCRDRDANEFVMAGRIYNHPVASTEVSVGPIDPHVACMIVPAGDVRSCETMLRSWLGDEDPVLQIAPVLAAKGSGEGTSRFVFSSSDIAEAYRHLKGIGAALHTKLEDAVRERVIRFSDPEGNRMEIVGRQQR